MPSVCDPRKVTWLSLSVHTNVSGTPAVIPELFLLSLILNSGETERLIENMELAQEPPHPTPNLTGKKQKFFCKSEMLNWLGAQATSGQRDPCPNPDSATYDLGNYFKAHRP